MRAQWGIALGDPGPFPSGAVGRDGDCGFVLIEDAHARSLGGALIWAARHELSELHLLVDTSAEVLAARAAPFRLPIHLWQVDGTSLRPTRPAQALPPHAEAPPPVEVFERLGLEVTLEHGVVAGEVLGLEVARWVEGRVEVGVGRFDREMSAMMHADAPPEAALERAVEFVRRHRYPGAPPHPLRDLCPERWLRVDLAGRRDLTPVPTVLPRPNLRDPHPALARADGALVACTQGVDPDLLPLAAASRQTGEQLVVVSTSPLPASVRRVGEWLEPPVQFETEPPPWGPVES